MAEQNNYELLTILRTEFLDALASISPETSKGLKVRDWTIKEIVAHLNNWLELYIERFRGLNSGTQPPLVTDIDAFNELGISKRSHSSYPELVEEFSKLSEQWLEMYGNMSETEKQKPFFSVNSLTPSKLMAVEVPHWQEHLADIKRVTNG